jgi:hypothetical protein
MAFSILRQANTSFLKRTLIAQRFQSSFYTTTARPSYSRQNAASGAASQSASETSKAAPSNPSPPSESSQPQLDVPVDLKEENGAGNGLSTDWSKSYHGLSTQAFPKEVADVLLAPIDPEDIECKPGTLTPFIMIYLLLIHFLRRPDLPSWN